MTARSRLIAIQKTNKGPNKRTIKQRSLQYKSSAMQLLPRQEQFYDSVTKLAHRYRIVIDMALFRNGPPSLLYICAPSGADSEAFQMAIDSHQLPYNTRLVAVNNGALSKLSRCPNVELREMTSAEDVIMRSEKNEFSHVWLDLTEVEPEMRMLFKLARTMRDPHERDCIYISLSKRCRNFAVQLNVMTAMCESVGLKISHVEEYTGSGSVKRNMMFFVCQVIKRFARLDNDVEFDENIRAIGSLAFVEQKDGHPREIMEWCTPNGKFMSNQAFVHRYNASTAAYLCSFFDPTGSLRDDKQWIPCEDVLKTTPWNVNWLKHKPMKIRPQSR
tara:strand:+ start:924 stop:1916 length:993 start_codon:yes stop_codon:yes gene_type:complete